MKIERTSSLTSGNYVARINTPIDPELEREFSKRFGPRPPLVTAVRRLLTLIRR